MKIAIDANILRALLGAAPKNDIRTYLNGAHFECGPAGIVAYVSTGAFLIVARLDSEPKPAGWLFAPAEWRVPAFPTNAALRIELSNGYKAEGFIEARLKYPGGELCHAFDSFSFNAPLFRRVIPRQVSGQAGLFNHEYLATFAKAAKVAGWGLPSIIPNGPNDAALVQFGKTREAFGVLMPMRGELMDTPPEWMNLPETVAA